MRRTAGYALWDHKRNTDILPITNLTDNRIHISI
jgi:hypothetical protein